MMANLILEPRTPVEQEPPDARTCEGIDDARAAAESMEAHR